jgi:predicted metal-binding protein
MIYLPKIVYDLRARDGTWCTLSYPNHRKGCPNFPQCPPKYIDFKEIEKNCTWYAVVEEFNLKDHAKRMKRIHPDWTERQCRNLLYWQGRVRAILKQETRRICSEGDIVLENPEASGIDVFKTMALVEIELKKNPDIVRKIMMIGRKKGIAHAA